MSRLAARILQYGTVKGKEQGSILGGLGNMLDGTGCSPAKMSPRCGYLQSIQYFQ